MDAKRFELTLEKFFQKAGVTLLKKDKDYDGTDESSLYILLDTKRKTYYLADTDNETTLLPDMETDAMADHLANKESLPKNVANAVLSLGKAVTFFSEGFTIPNVDILNFTRKSALIVNESNAEVSKEYLTSRGITFQSVPFKGAFLVMFLDKGSSEQISDIYQAISSEYMNTPSATTTPPATEQAVEENHLNDIADISDLPNIEDINQELAGLNVPHTEETPKEGASLSFDELIGNVPDIDDDEEETPPKNKPIKNETIKTEPIKEEQVDQTEEDELLDSIDLSFIQTPPKEELSEEEGDLLYSKLINEQVISSSTDTPAPAPKAVKGRDIPKDVMDAFELDPEDVLNDQAVAAEVAESVKGKKTKEKKPRAIRAIGDVGFASKLAANISGFLFFAPSYIIGKLTSRVLPPFIIYWLGAIAVIFGVYQIVFSLVSPFFYPYFTEIAHNASTFMVSVVNGSATLPPIDNAANNMLISSSIYYKGQIAAAAGVEGSWFLRYLMSFGAILMIFPLTRKLGGRLTVFSVLMFFATPLILGAEAYMLNALTDNILTSAFKATSHSDALSIYASGVTFIVFIAPIIIIGLLYIIAGYFIPDKSKHTEVLP